MGCFRAIFGGTPRTARRADERRARNYAMAPVHAYRLAELRDGRTTQRAGFALSRRSDEIVVTYETYSVWPPTLEGWPKAMPCTNGYGPTGRQVPSCGATLCGTLSGRRRTHPCDLSNVYLHGWAPHESQPKALRPGSATARLRTHLARHRQTTTDPRYGRRSSKAAAFSNRGLRHWPREFR